MSSRNVLVTGASRGIGAATAQAFAAAGDRVAVHYGVRREQAQAVRDALPGEGHIVAGADLADPDAVQVMTERVAAELGSIDVLVNNAGIFVTHPIDTSSYAEWRQAWRETLDVNLVGPANLTWCAVRHMGPGGRIVCVGSRGGFRGEPGQPAYGASKAAIVAFAQSLAIALGPRGIAVSTVAPGFVETDMATEALAGEAGVARRAESPFGKVAAPQDVAAAIVYLASPQAEMASGTVIDVNGASFLRM